MIIKRAEFIKSAITYDDILNVNKFPEFIFIGRSNVGKSSFINSLTSRKNLAKTSQTPGKTRCINVFNINSDILFLDLPGYGYSIVSKDEKQKFKKMMDNYFLNTKCLTTAFLLLDGRHKPTTDDINMYEYLKFHNINVVLIITKKDKIKKSLYYKNLEIIKNTLKFKDKDYFFISNHTKDGIKDVLNYIKITKEMYYDSIFY